MIKRTSSRITNIKQWLRHPGELVAVGAAIAFFGLLLILAFPCGRWDHPIAGVCSDGSSLLSVSSLLVIVSLGVVTPILMAIFNPAPSNVESSSLFKTIFKNKKPKWYRKWFPLIFLVNYLLFSAVAYYFYKNGGLRWFNYVAIYGVLVPFLAISASDVVLNKLRSFSRTKK